MPGTSGTQLPVLGDTVLGDTVLADTVLADTVLADMGPAEELAS
jgi:hypothetical protein